MKTLATVSDHDIGLSSNILVGENWRRRTAARAVVFDGSRVALLWVGKSRYYKLPGGGIDDGESIEVGLDRESVEEIGYHLGITNRLGKIVEHWGREMLLQTSYCYIANIKGPQLPVEYTKNEIDNGFEVRWAADLDEAISLVSSALPLNYEGQFIKNRDIKFLAEARKIIA